MAFFTFCCIKRRWLNALWHGLWAIGIYWLCASAWAQNGVEVSQFRAERSEDGVVISAQLQFELSAAVEDALTKGIPVVFVSTADILRERWYWYDKKVATTERHFRLAFQPLTRKWRLQTSSGAASAGSYGLALNQLYDSLAEALVTIKRIARWKVAEASDIEAGLRYRVEFRFALDVGQMPRPFQIGTLGQSDWDLSALVSAPLLTDSAK